ncbi:MAG: serine/threonine protein kinase [Leptolyngbyaceae cyanobacterium RU_5_1]|nr:serine/threonine protein kinase [Leptolyngbyaceae cyanobacterium RU_5_1]
MSNLFAKELHRSKYRLLGLVGQGQFGRVYCASHRKTGRLVALKELDRQRFSTHNFLRELRFLLSLQHDHIVTCQALEQTRTGRYLVMDYCEGGTLRSLLDEDVRLHPIQGLKLVMQVLVGLEHAHQQGIVHCDVKPENILLTVSPEGWIARISDFGIARLNLELSKAKFSNTGSPAYMAPERFYGQHSPASDLYAVGILLFEVLTGHRPFSGVPAELMSAHLNQTVKLPDNIPAELKTTLLTALQKLPARRFRSAAEMLNSLQIALHDSEQLLNQEWDSSTLLRPCVPLPKCPLQFVYREPLQAPVQQLVSSSGVSSSHELNHVHGAIAQLAENGTPATGQEQIYRVFGNSVGCQSLELRRLETNIHSRQKPQTSTEANAISQLELPITAARLPAPVLNVLVRPQGNFAVTQRAVYLLPPELFRSGMAQHNQDWLQSSLQTPSVTSCIVPQLVTTFNRDVLLTVEAQGRWMATATLEPNNVHSTLNIWSLRHPHPFKPAIAVQSAPCFQILALDNRYLVTFSHQTDQGSHSCITGVLLKFFTRRGNRVGSLELPIPLRQISLTSTPYRLLAMEPGYPNSVMFLDLKPLRIQRVGLDIAPQRMVATQWGYVLMDANGQIVLLNSYGQRIGQIDGPAHSTAIAA